jgi:alpha/beta superfamily hydrolase
MEAGISFNTGENAVRQSAVSFKVKELTFEGVVVQPTEPGPDQAGPAMPGVVVCHPHPLYGGNMDNNVVLTVSFALAQVGFAVLRFNFRGVGHSEGEHTKGKLEPQEALAALELLKAWPGVDERRIGLAGYSFGSGVVLGNPELHQKAKAFALISPSVRALEGSTLGSKDLPTLVIAGDQDKAVQSEEFSPALDAFKRPPTRHIVPGADHYWFGYEDQLGPPVAEFFAEALQ